MAGDTDAEYERHMAEARKRAAAAKNAPSAQPPAPAVTAADDPDSAAFEQQQAAARDAQQRAQQEAAARAQQEAAAAARQPPPPQTTWGGVARNVLAGLTDAGANALNYFASPSGSIGQLPATAAVAAHDVVAPWFGYPRFPDDVRNLLLGDQVPQPGTRLVNMTGNALGVDPSQIPAATDAERLARKATAAAATVPIMTPTAVGPILRSGLAAATGAVTGDVLSQYVPDWLKPGVELAGNVAGAKAGAAATSLGTKTASFATGRTTPVMDAYTRLNIDPDLMGDVSQNPTARSLQAYATKAPFGSGVVAPVAEKVIGQFGNAVEDTAARLDPTRNAASEQAAGSTLQTEARNWRDTVFPAREQAAWAPVDQAMAGAAVDPAHYRAALASLTAKLSALPETQLQLLPPKTRALLDAINKDVPAGSTMPWEQAQSLRSAIGQVMGVPEIVQSVGKSQLKAAYGGISEDMRTSAVNNGADSLFANANKVSTEGHAFIDNTLSKIIRSNNPAQETIRPEQATRAILGGGDTTLQAVRNEMPAAADAVAAFKIRDMATARPGQAGATGTETSVGTFLTDLNKFRQDNPAGFAALYANPEVAQRLNDLATVAATMKETARGINTSNTGQQVAWATAIPSAVHAAYTSGGAPAAVAAATLPFLGNYLAGKAVTSHPLTEFAAAPGPRVPISPLAASVAANIDAQRQRNALAAQP